MVSKKIIPKKPVCKFTVSDEQLDKVKKILKTEHLFIFAGDPKLIKGGLFGCSFINSLNSNHLLKLSNNLMDILKL
jgi:hypothetical protein